MKGIFLAVCDGLRNETFACSEKNELIKIDGQRALCLFYFCVHNFINAFNFFVGVFFFGLGLLITISLTRESPWWIFHVFLFRRKIQRRSEKLCDKEKKPPTYEPIEFLKFCSHQGAANFFNFVLACMTSSHHSEDLISLNCKCTVVILYQLCFGVSQKYHFLQEDYG